MRISRALREPMPPHGVWPWPPQELPATIGVVLYLRPIMTELLVESRVPRQKPSNCQQQLNLVTPV